MDYTLICMVFLPSSACTAYHIKIVTRQEVFGIAAPTDVRFFFARKRSASVCLHILSFQQLNLDHELFENKKCG